MEANNNLEDVSEMELGIGFDTAGSQKTAYTKMIANLIPYSETKEEQQVNKEALNSISKLPSIFALLGLHEMCMMSLYKALLIEFVGTASFVYIHISIIAACRAYIYPPLQIGIAHAILISLFIYQFAMSSGAHFNSLISMSSIITGHLPFLRGILYIMMQIFGAAAGAAIMRESLPAETASALALGGCRKGDLTSKQALAIEFFFSLALLYPVYGTAFNLRQREIYGPVLPPVIIGITLGMIIFSSASLAPPPFTGAGSNPSLCLGTAWAYYQSDLSNHTEALNFQWVYWVGPIMASLVNAAIYGFAPPHHDSPVVVSSLPKMEVNLDDASFGGANVKKSS